MSIVTLNFFVKKSIWILPINVIKDLSLIYFLVWFRLPISMDLIWWLQILFISFGGMLSNLLVFINKLLLPSFLYHQLYFLLLWLADICIASLVTASGLILLRVFWMFTIKRIVVLRIYCLIFIFIFGLDIASRLIYLGFLYLLWHW